MKPIDAIKSLVNEIPLTNAQDEYIDALIDQAYEAGRLDERYQILSLKNILKGGELNG